MTDLLYGLDAAERERVAALRAEGRFFWLDVSLSETSRGDLVDALGIPERAQGALRRTRDGSASRAFHADGESVVFALRCYVEIEPENEQDGYRLRPIEVHVLLTSDYLLTLHHERVSLQAVLAPDLPQGRSKRYVVYSVLDAMLATTSDALDEVEVRLDALVATWTEGDSRSVPRATLRQAGARLATMRRWVKNEQAVFERVDLEIGALRDFGTSEEPYFDRLEDQVSRLLTSIDAAANAMGMVLDLQLNERAYRGQRRRRDLRPAHVDHGLLRHELRLDGRPGRQPGRLLAARIHRSDRDSGAVMAFPGASVRWTYGPAAAGARRNNGRFGSAPANRQSEAVRAEALGSDEQRQGEEDDRHRQAVCLSPAHVRRDRADHGQRQSHRGERGEKWRYPQCSRQNQPQRPENLEQTDGAELDIADGGGPPHRSRRQPSAGLRQLRHAGREKDRCKQHLGGPERGFHASDDRRQTDELSSRVLCDWDRPAVVELS